MKNIITVLKRFSAITIVLISNLTYGQQKNVLFIAVDDLKPNLGCYGDKMAVSPNIDSLAQMGTIFGNAHTQQAVCAPSRASLLTGWRPDRTQVWDLHTLIRDKNPDVVTLPQYFKENGYQTLATGKVFDPRSVDDFHDAPSWSVPYVQVTAPKYMEATETVATEAADYPDDDYKDGKVALAGIDLLKQAAENDQPFFVAVGFAKPHLPFVAPQKYWDLYDRDSIQINPFQEFAANSPDYAYQPGWELRSYADIPDVGEDIPEDKQIEVIHGYYACVSFVDAQVQRVINELDSLGLRDSTIIVLWGDHGWHLGDHAMWAKHSNFEQATRSPLIIVDPDIPGGKYVTSPVEFVDIFPTLCELTGLPIPDSLAGTSLVPILSGQTDRVKDYAVSQYHRNGTKEGYTIRADRYRYTEWLDINYREGVLPYSDDIVIDRELYDYKTDPRETVSLIYDPAYKSVLDSMKAMLADFLKNQFPEHSTPDTDHNLLYNGSFENDVNFWIQRACSFEITDAFAQDSAHSLFISNRTKVWGGAAQTFTSNLAEEGKGDYILSAYYRSESGIDTAKLQVKLTYGGQSKYIQAFGTFDSNGWTHIVDTLTLSWDNTLEEAKVTAMTVGDISKNYYVDNISIIKDSVYTAISKDFNTLKAQKFELFANYPNPFNPVTNISFSLPHKSRVKLVVYSLLGEKVADLTDNFYEAGRHNILFNGEKLASGVYIYHIQAGNFSQSRKMILMK